MGPTFFRYSILPSISLQVTQLGFIQAILMSGRQHKKLNLLTVGPSLAVSLESLAHRRIVASLSLFCKYYFCRCSSELAELVLLPYFQGRSTGYSDRLDDFSFLISRCYKDVCQQFPCTTRLWNSLCIECFPFTCDLSGLKSRINRHLLTAGFF